MEYEEFLKSKIKNSVKSGFQPKEMNPLMKDHQKYATEKAIRAGRYALFLDTGLGKTICQLEWARQVSEETGRPVLILAPLSVVNQTKETEARKFGYDIEIWNNTVDKSKGLFIVNYEQLESIDCDLFSGVVLDESSILKNTEGKNRNLIIKKFKNTPYKLACSATPSPNDHMELGNHSEFLGQMTYTEMLAMFFVHDGGDTSKWRLRKHAEKDFWNYVLSWSLAMDNPSTFGFEGKDYKLPKAHYIEHFIDIESDNLDLFGEAIVSATQLYPVLRQTIDERIEKAVEIFNSAPNEQWLFWCLSNKEAEMLNRIIPNSCNVQGKDDPEIKAKNLLGFVDGNPHNLITKTKIASMGMNYQHANHMLFVAFDFSFEKFYQAVRRMLRAFNIHEDVYIHIIVPKNQINVKKKIEIAEEQHKEMIRHLAVMSSEHETTNTIGLKMEDIITDEYKCLIGDCVKRARDLENDELDLVVFSPPFSELYVYSDKLEDMGNSKDYREFERHFRYLIPEISRTLKSGRICAVHCMDLPVQKGKEGFIGLRDFSGMLISWFQEEGFIYHSKVTIWKNPVVEMQRTKALGLLHKQIKKDAVMSRVGIPDYVLFFRNKGDNKIPIIHQDIDQSMENYLPVDMWQKYASPVWFDVDYTRTLQYTTARDSNDEKHIAPLQLDTVERIIHLYSNERETVGSFFGGIGTEGYQAIKMNRRSISIELKESYFKVNVKNHQRATDGKKVMQLF